MNEVVEIAIRKVKPGKADVGVAEAEVSNVRAMAGSDVVEAYDEVLSGMARRNS